MKQFGPNVKVLRAHPAGNSRNDSYVFVEMGEAATPEQMFKELEVEGRFDAMIDKLLKRLLFLKGLKSLPAAAASAPLPRIRGPGKAA
jgi:hypothetical protein